MRRGRRRGRSRKRGERTEALKPRAVVLGTRRGSHGGRRRGDAGGGETASHTTPFAM